MTEQEAQRLLNEHRTVRPVFIDGRYRYVVRQDGRIEVWLAVGKSGLRWKSDGFAPADACWVPARVRERAAEHFHAYRSK